MRTTPLKKLGLEKETIKNLNLRDLVEVRGGSDTDYCDTAACDPGFSREASCTTTHGTCLPV